MKIRIVGGFIGVAGIVAYSAIVPSQIAPMIGAMIAGIAAAVVAKAI